MGDHCVGMDAEEISYVRGDAPRCRAGWIDWTGGGSCGGVGSVGWIGIGLMSWKGGGGGDGVR